MFKIAKYTFITVKFFTHITSIGFAIIALWNGDWTEFAAFATFAIITGI